MYTRRVHLLVEEPVYTYLAATAEQQETSVAELIRTAVAEKYLLTDSQEDWRDAFAAVTEFRQGIKPQATNYQELINEGRRF